MTRMNGTEPKIEIFKPFGEAFELMKKILFQPFDLKKWFVIGFAAWLANLGGGGGFNYQYNRRDKMHKLNEAISQIPQPILVTGICVLILVVLVFAFLIAWLRARGGFMFIDCIVKNRGAIAEPWREFRTEGNSYFLFSLLVGVVLLIGAALFSLPLLVPLINDVSFFRTHHVYVIVAIAALIFLMVFVVLVWTLIASFMLPVMYRQRCRASEAFNIVTRLIAAYPGEIVLYCLFLIVLGLATVIVACLATCVTCCIAAIPYIGTVILLPIFILLRSFSLLFIRQFGPNYDVWASFMPPEFSPILVSVPPLQPPPISSSDRPSEPPPGPSL
jgi:MFS family permease